MRDLMQILALIKIGESEAIDIAKGKYQYNGKILESIAKILRNGRENLS